MKKRLVLALSFLLFHSSFLIPHLEAQPLYVGSYNIRYQNNDDNRAGNSWRQRCPVVCGQLMFEHPDIFGAQEVLHSQLMDMLRLLPDYGYIGVGREDGAEKGEYAPIFYDKQKLQLLSHGHFWLAETPDKPVLGWDAACVRICTWGQFRDVQNATTFFFFNLHMDHMGVVARRESAKLVVSHIRQLAGTSPVILTGDFNVDQTNEIYRIFTSLLTDSYVAARHRFAENGTFNAFDQERKTYSRIDHVFVSPSFTVQRCGILTNTYWQQEGDSITRRLPSDHYPVFVHLDYSSGK
jgi:endonuclease/exonuclease/phosphatase family metal-dependent hydrolase